MRVAVGIPSYCEADSIAHVVRQADLGLAALAGASERWIVNVDGASPDATVATFQSTPTRASKVSLVVRETPGGKGRNVLRFLRWALERDCDALLTLDADLRSVEPDWIMALAGPILDGAADYATPLYRRSRFDAATTNHLAYPLVSAVAGRELRQPIAGDFGLSRGLARHLIAQRTAPAVLGYGIDVFMTLHAVGAGFRVVQVPLGRKLHKSSFAKRPRIIRDVAAVALDLAPRLGPARSLLPPEPGLDSIDEDRVFAHADEARRIYPEIQRRALARRELYGAWAGEGSAEALERALRAPEPALRAELWAELLAGAFCDGLHAAASAPELADRLEPVHLLRSLTFWRDNAACPARLAEQELTAQAAAFRAALATRLDAQARWSSSA